jgi:hypothetical protein
MRPLFNLKSTMSVLAKSAGKKSSGFERSKLKGLRPRKKDMSNAHLLSQSVLNFAKAAFVIVLTVVFIVLACSGKIDTKFFNTLVGAFSPFF